MTDRNQIERSRSNDGPTKAIRHPRLPPPPPPLPTRPPRRIRSNTSSPDYPSRNESLFQTEDSPNSGVPQQYGAYQRAVVLKGGAAEVAQKSLEREYAGALAVMEKSPEGASGGAKPKNKSNLAEFLRDNRSKDPLSSPKKKDSPRNAPERPRVSMNPAGRSDYSPRLPSNYGDSEESPKKGMIRSFFSKAKDFFFKKPHYTQLEQGDETETAKSPTKFYQPVEKYTRFDDDASKSMSPPARYFLEQYSKSSAKVSPLPAEELESSGEKSEESLDLRLATGQKPDADAVSDHGSDCSDYDYHVATETAWPIIPLPSSARASFRAKEADSDLCSIQVNTPAQVHVAYAVTGHVTTCIRQTADASLSSRIRVRITRNPDEDQASDEQETYKLFEKE